MNFGFYKGSYFEGQKQNQKGPFIFPPLYTINILLYETKPDVNKIRYIAICAVHWKE